MRPILAAVLAAAMWTLAPGTAEAGPSGVCCVCDCVEPATTSQVADPSPTQVAPEGGACVDNPSPSGCNTRCTDLGCSLAFVRGTGCNDTPGCAQANQSTMAPLASTGTMLAIAITLGALGIRAARRRII